MGWMAEEEAQTRWEAQRQAEEEGKRLELEGCAAEHEAERETAEEIEKALRMKIYIAAPYTKGDPEQNTLVVLKVADRLLELGYIPIVPHLSHYWQKVSPKPWATWINIGKALLEGCDALLRLPGQSEGADIEVDYAKRLNIPVFHNIQELRYWTKAVQKVNEEAR